MGALLYGRGMRLGEYIRLRVKDIDFGCGEIVVRDGKGGKDCPVPLPKTLRAALQDKVDRVRVLRAGNIALGFGPVRMPMPWSASIRCWVPGRAVVDSQRSK